MKPRTESKRQNRRSQSSYGTSERTPPAKRKSEQSVGEAAETQTRNIRRAIERKPPQ